MYSRHPISCLFCFYLSTVVSVIYLGSVQPQADRGIMKLEIFNEMIILAFIAALSGFLGSSFNAKMQYDLGWLCCSIIGLYLLVHMINTFSSMISNLIKNCKKKCYRNRKTVKPAEPIDI